MQCVVTSRKGRPPKSSVFTISHLRLTTYEHGEHHLTIALHSPLCIGTLSAILADVSTHFKLNREQLLEKLSG
jgi:hypothetical protein